MKRVELAEALDVAPQTLHAWMRRGLTVPQEGETLQQWVERAQAWRKATRKKTGPPPLHEQEDGDETLHHWTVRHKKALALKYELENQGRRGELHSHEECERAHVRCCAEFNAAFGNFGDLMARRLFQATPEQIKAEIDAEVRRRLELLADGKVWDAFRSEPRDAGGAAAAGAGDGK
jgi:phage terminase Nu1 subunit (DNA packaging protein)